MENDKPGPGKFEGNESLSLSEKLHEMTLDGWCTDELGDVQHFGWYGLLISPFSNEDEKDIPFDKVESGPSYIVHEDNNGFFDYTEFANEQIARDMWSQLEGDYTHSMYGNCPYCGTEQSKDNIEICEHCHKEIDWDDIE
jgi:hypothetical protein